MTKRPPTDMGASAFNRLKALTRSPNQDFNLTLIRYGCERLLYRLSQSPHSRSFMLKGATLFVVWEGEPHRPTRDIDLLGFGEDSAERLRAVFGDALAAWDTEATMPTLLEFPAPRLRAYPAEAVVAEKLHAMAQHGMLNSRMKDVYDVQALAARLPFDGESLAEAVRLTFERRDRLVGSKLPAPLTVAFTTDEVMLQRWAGFLRRNRLEPVELVTAVDRLRTFLLEPWEALVQGDRFAKAWLPGGPWRATAGL